MSGELGARHFAAGRWLAAHEAWEEEWRATPAGAEREVLRALAQAAAACQHESTGNARGARSLAQKALEPLLDAGFPEVLAHLRRLAIDPDITLARTLPGSFYSDAEAFERSRERVFARAWYFLGGSEIVGEPRSLRPFTLAPGLLDEPLLFARDRDGARSVLSNVCTHRGAILLERECRADGILCRYHGRRFDAQGNFLSCPGFEGAQQFPRTEDSLASLPLESLGKLLFTSLAPERPFAELFGPIAARLAWFPFDDLVLDRARSRDYLVAAHWALYCENYLEGLHIPFVHPALNSVLDFESYTTELFERCNLQVGRAQENESCFEIPAGAPDHGQRIAGYYWWFFPNLMINVYPWGVSINVVEPLALDKTRVRFLIYVARPELVDTGAGAGLHQVELEDEAVVESVQRGVRARLYPGGRFSPAREQGVHQFQRLLASALA